MKLLQVQRLGVPLASSCRFGYSELASYVAALPSLRSGGASSLRPETQGIRLAADVIKNVAF